MHQFRSLRRLVLGAAITGAALGAVPALASASSTCGYDGSIRAVSVVDGSGTLPLRIVADNGLIELKDGPSGLPITCGGSDNVANVNNTDQINIFGPVATNVDGLVVDQSGGSLAPGFTPEASGNSEIEITTFTDANRRPSLTVIGDARQDTIKVASNGLVDLDTDGDVDLSALSGASFVTLNGNGGQDLLGGDGFLGLGSTTVPLFLNGGAGADQLIGGLAHDEFNGGSDGDVFHAIGGSNDTIFGGSGFDTANADKIDRFTDVVEQRNIAPIGRVKLAPRVLKAEAGMISRLKVSWKHPQSWRELRKLKLSLYDGKQAVGMINARPASGRLTGTGAVELMSGSKLSHHGKWVTAKLALEVPKSLAGKDLRVAVQATDKHGNDQLVRNAGTIKVGR